MMNLYIAVGFLYHQHFGSDAKTVPDLHNLARGELVAVDVAAGCTDLSLMQVHFHPTKHSQQHIQEVTRCGAAQCTDLCLVQVHFGGNYL